MSDEEQQGLDKELSYRYHKSFIQLEFANYKKNGDRRHLANICREVPFFDEPEVGEEIARLLTLDRALPKLKKIVGTERALEEARLKHYWEARKGRAADQAVFQSIAHQLGWTGYEVEKRVEMRLRRMGLIKNKK